MKACQYGQRPALPPCVVGTFTVTILLLAGRGSLAVMTLPVIKPDAAAIWNVCPDALMLLAATVVTEVVEAARHMTNGHLHKTATAKLVRGSGAHAHLLIKFNTSSIITH